MTLAVITAYSAGYRRVAQLTMPSHKCLAARARGQFYELPLPEDGEHNWHKVALISSYLVNHHAVLWLDADCIVPQKYELPISVNGQRYFFPMTRVGEHLHHWCFASYWINSSESALLLAKLMELRPAVSHDGLADEAALNLALSTSPIMRSAVGPMPRGLIHYHGIPSWEKAQKLRADTCA